VTDTTPDLSRLKALAACCRKCKHVVGEYAADGRAIKLGGAVIRQRVTLFCAACGGRNGFRPSLTTGGPQDQAEVGG
jgi:hypothetical protein